MFKNLLFLSISLFFIQNAYGQTEPGTARSRLTDSLCHCFSNVNMSEIISKNDARKAFTECFKKYNDLIIQEAREEKQDPNDSHAMEEIGKSIGINLIKKDCSNFINLSLLMADKGSLQLNNFEEGQVKRIETKEFITLVLTDSDNQEKRYLWFRQFPNSEKFMANTQSLIARKLKIGYNELEVYIPSAHAYYKIKEITSMEFIDFNLLR